MNMTRYDTLQICVYISNNALIPLELLWHENNLTELGAITLLFFYLSIYKKLIYYLKSNSIK